MLSKDNFINISIRSFEKISRENIKKALEIAAANYSKGKLVDLGCGTKPYEKIFTPHIESYFGIDYAVSAQVNYGNLTRADLFADCTDTGLPDESFDSLLSTQVMEHILETSRYVAECYRLLKIEGFGIFTIPFVWQCHSEPFDYYRFTQYSLKELFQKEGFDIVKIAPLEGAFATLIQMWIVSIMARPTGNNLLVKIVCKTINMLLVPPLNLIALRFDKVFWNNKLCLNYLVIVQKKTAQPTK